MLMLQLIQKDKLNNYDLLISTENLWSEKHESLDCVLRLLTFIMCVRCYGTTNSKVKVPMSNIIQIYNVPVLCGYMTMLR